MNNDNGYTVDLPAKPGNDQRAVQIDGKPMQMAMQTADAGDAVFAHHQRDDIAILIARLSRIAADHHISWTLPHELISAGQARALLRDPMGNATS